MVVRDAAKGANKEELLMAVKNWVVFPLCNHEMGHCPLFLMKLYLVLLNNVRRDGGLTKGLPVLTSNATNQNRSQIAGIGRNFNARNYWGHRGPLGDRWPLSWGLRVPSDLCLVGAVTVSDILILGGTLAVRAGGFRGTSAAVAEARDCQVLSSVM